MRLKSVRIENFKQFASLQHARELITRVGPENILSLESDDDLEQDGGRKLDEARRLRRLAENLLREELPEEIHDVAKRLTEFAGVDYRP